MGGFFVLSWRLIVIQYLEPSSYIAHSEKDKESTTILHGIRGHIVDRNDQTIARSIPHGELWIYTGHFDQHEPALSALAWEKCLSHPEWHGLEIPKQKKMWKEETKQMRKSFPSKHPELRERYLAYAIDHIAPALTIKRDDLVAQIQAKNAKKISYFKIFTDLDEEASDRLEEIISANKIGGFDLIKSARREYTSDTFAPHIVGYTRLIAPKEMAGKDTVIGESEYRKEIGAYGIEAAAEKHLGGIDGYRRCTISASGNLIGNSPGITVPSKHGASVMLTLDMEIQNILQEELQAAVQTSRAERGCIIVMDPHTGEVLGLANYPTFRLKNIKKEDTETLNFATEMIYEPGSTIKCIAFAAALNEQVISRTTSINCHNGSFQRGKLSIKDHHSYGVLSSEWVMGKSSNIGTFMIASLYGMDQHYQYLKKFGFGKATGIFVQGKDEPPIGKDDPPIGEVNGIFQVSDNLTEFASKTYGYNISVTPIQMAAAYSVIANGGKLMKPQLIKAIIAPNGSIIEKFEPITRGQSIISERAAKETRLGLQTVLAKGGTAVQANVPGYTACGKTGTVKKYKPAVIDPVTKKIITPGYYENNRYICSFAGMLPAEKPKFVCVVVIDDPKSDKVSGGEIAGPVFSRTCLRVAEHLHIKPTVAIAPHVANQ